MTEKTEKTWQANVMRFLMKHGPTPAIIIATGIAVAIVLRYGH
jgi:hypothetical protein